MLVLPLTATASTSTPSLLRTALLVSSSPLAPSRSLHTSLRNLRASTAAASAEAGAGGAATSGPWSDPLPVPTASNPSPTLNRYLVVAEDYRDAGALARRLEVRERHLEDAKLGKSVGRIELGGALLKRDFPDIDEETGPIHYIGGSVLVVLGESVADVRSRLLRDEYSLAGVFDPTRTRIFPFLRAAIEAPPSPVAAAAAASKGPLTLSQLRKAASGGVGGGSKATPASTNAAVASSAATAAAAAGKRISLASLRAAPQQKLPKRVSLANLRRGFHTSVRRSEEGEAQTEGKATTKSLSACAPGTILSGLSLLKDKPDPVALPDEKYPSWLWSLADDSSLGGGEASLGALMGAATSGQMSKGEARVAQKKAMKMVRAANEAKARAEKAAAAKKKKADDAAAAAKGGASSSSAFSKEEGEQVEEGSEEVGLDEAKAAKEKREALAEKKRQLRKANKASIKGANFLGSN